MSESQRGLLRANVLYAIAMWGMVAVGLAISLIALVGGGALSMDPYGPLYSLSIALAEFLPIALPSLILLALPKGRPMIRAMRLRFTPSALLAVPTAVGGYLFVIGVSAVWMAFLSSIGLSEDAGVPLPADGQQFGVSILIIAVVPALCEELLFRGMMLPAYERHLRSPLAAIAFTGLIFGLMHGQPSGAPGHILLGVVMGALVYVTDSIWTGVIYHFTNNACAMTLSYFSAQLLGDQALSGLPESVPPQLLAISGLMYMAVGAVVFGLFIAIYYAIYARTLKQRSAEEGERYRREAALAPLAHQRRGQRFLPWLPLVIAAPVAIGSYLVMTLAMLFSGLL